MEHNVLLGNVAKLKKGDQVLIDTGSFCLPFIAALVSLLKGASYTLHFHDRSPQVIAARRPARSRSGLARIKSFLDRWLYKYAAGIIVENRENAEIARCQTAGLDIPVFFMTEHAVKAEFEHFSVVGDGYFAKIGSRDRFSD